MSRAARLRLRLVRYDVESRYVIDEEPVLQPAGPIPGRPVRLIRDGEMLQVYTDSDGWATVGRVRPGAWQISVPSDSVPPGYRLDPSSLDLVLAPGEVVEREVPVLPILRQVRIQEVRGVSGSSQGEIVLSPQVREIAVRPAAVTLRLGDTLRFSVSATYNDESTVDVAGSAVWVSEDPDVAAVEGGVVEGRSVGTTRIVARYANLTSLPIRVEVVDVPEPFPEE